MYKSYITGVLLVTAATVAHARCPEDLTLEQLVDCYGGQRQAADTATEGTRRPREAPKEPEQQGPAELVTTDVDC